MINENLTRAAIVTEARERFPAEHGLFLRMGDCVIEARTNDPALKEELDRYFEEFLCVPGEPDILVTAHECDSTDFGAEYTVKRPDPGKTKIKEQWADIEGGRIVFKRLTGMAFVFGQGENIAVGPCRENPNQVINFINNRFIERMLNAAGLLGHAAGVSLNGRGLAMAGFSGMGKSTLALHCMSRGTDFVSNDRIMVRENDDGLTMYGVAKHPRINPGTALANPDLAGIVAPGDRERFQALPMAELWELEHKYDAIIADCFAPGRFHLKAPMTGLVLLNWERDGSPLVARRVNPVERKDLLPAFMKATGLFYLPERDDVPKDPPMERYAEVLSRCKVIELTGGVVFDAAADLCLRFLETGKTPADSLNGAAMVRIRITKEAVIPNPAKLRRFEISPELGPKILFFSGGSALRDVSRHIIRYTHNTIHLITPFDSGGSSAKLREAFGMPAIGDVRNRLMALTDRTFHGNHEVVELFAHRFPKDGAGRTLRAELDTMARGRHPLVSAIPDPMRKIIRHHLRTFVEWMPPGFDLRGASIGNLVLTAGYLDNRRHLDPVIYIFSKLAEVRGVVRPIVSEDLHLAATLEDGTEVFGQHNLTGKEASPIASKVKSIRLARSAAENRLVSPRIRDKIKKLIAAAELIVFPMGSFYSSIVANLLPDGVGAAVAANPCPKVFIPNLGSDPEIPGQSVQEQLTVLLHHLRNDSQEIHTVPVNFLLMDLSNGAYPMPLNRRSITAKGVEIIDCPMVTGQSAPLLDAARVSEALLSLT